DEAVFGLKNASGTGQQQLQIQVFGELEFSDLVDKEIKLKPGPVPNKDIYRAGPQIVICDAH
ncbi:MAG TPA: hypothetical protein VN838_11755, partial [Bradyrhizobium sp.]|nr:hypothetical protein [Bradyrhizobium sp.]